jgi:hypothetical protein
MVDLSPKHSEEQIKTKTWVFYFNVSLLHNRLAQKFRITHSLSHSFYGSGLWTLQTRSLASGSQGVAKAGGQPTSKVTLLLADSVSCRIEKKNGRHFLPEDWQEVFAGCWLEATLILLILGTWNTVTWWADFLKSSQVVNNTPVGRVYSLLKHNHGSTYL